MKSTEVEKRVYGEIKNLEGEIIQTLQEVVRIPSVVGHEGKVQESMAKLYQSLGLEVIIHTPNLEKVKSHPAFIDTEMSYEGRPNVIGYLRGNPRSPSLILNGHTDVVSPEPIESWGHDPWGAEIVGDRIYGRGTGDMKAGLVANFFALKAILKAGFRPKGTVILQSVTDEEAGGAGGTLACLMDGHRAEGMLITEPHNLNVTISHAGVNYFRVKVLGKTSHAAISQLGVNAISKMYPIFQSLIDLDERRGREIKFPLFEKGTGRSCNLSVGTMKAGDWPSNVAGSAEIECRVGFIPGEKMADIKKLIADTVNQAAQKDPWLREHPPKVEWFGWQADPWYQDPEHPFVQNLKKAAESVLGHDVEYIGRAGGIDSRFAQYFNMVACCTGPKAGGIHAPNEYVEIPSVFQLTQILAKATLDWCGTQDGK